MKLGCKPVAGRAFEWLAGPPTSPKFPAAHFRRKCLRRHGFLALRSEGRKFLGMPVEKIMVVDDEPIIRKSFEELLRPKRYSITSVGSLSDAERLLKKDNFDMLFLDVRLPDGEGTDLLERLVKLPDRPEAVDYVRPPVEDQRFVPDHAAELAARDAVA